VAILKSLAFKCLYFVNMELGHFLLQIFNTFYYIHANDFLEEIWHFSGAINFFLRVTNMCLSLEDVSIGSLHWGNLIFLCVRRLQNVRALVHTSNGTFCGILGTCEKCADSEKQCDRSIKYNINFALLLHFFETMHIVRRGNFSSGKYVKFYNPWI